MHICRCGCEVGMQEPENGKNDVHERGDDDSKRELLDRGGGGSRGSHLRRDGGEEPPGGLQGDGAGAGEIAGALQRERRHALRRPLCKPAVLHERQG